jgi:hypothetical protein
MMRKLSFRTRLVFDYLRMSKCSIRSGKFVSRRSADLPVILPDERQRTGFLAPKWPQGKLTP